METFCNILTFFLLQVFPLFFELNSRLDFEKESVGEKSSNPASRLSSVTADQSQLKVDANQEVTEMLGHISLCRHLTGVREISDATSPSDKGGFSRVAV